MEKGRIAWSIPERNRGDARSKEKAVTESRWAETGSESLIWAAQEQALRKNALKKWYWSPWRVPTLQALKSESWMWHPFCQFVFCPSWKPILEETDKIGKKYTGSYTRNLRLNVKTNGSRINQNQWWKMTNAKYFGTLQSKQIKK